MKRLVQSLLLILVIAYPLIIYFGLSLISLRYVILMVMFLFFIRLLFINRKKQSKSVIPISLIILMTILGIFLCLFSLVFNSEYLLKLYPFMVNVLLFITFLYSFINPPTIIERFALIIEKKALPKEAIRYMRKVTVAWVIFFFINGLIAFITASYSSLKIWSLYNGFIAYILIALMFLIEYIIRLKVKKRMMLDND
ncbi:hypothetical protein L3V79_00265 [Thiotrichales bacterium 19S9-12]|nr:hypothetical protein [Thiotrichales bacterium 19S9-11]MCF6810800.1 hypothetical protein [Thiotrichales bacterium 19S9-12]